MTSDRAVDVRVGRLVARCRAPTGTPVARVTRAVAEELAIPLARSVSAAAPDGYWLIRRIDVRTQVGAGWASRRLADAVAREIGEQVRVRARRGQDASGVLWFPDRESFLAGFLLDLARDRVAGRWEYAGLAGSGDWVEAAVDLAGRPGLLEAVLLRLSAAELDELAERVAGDRLLEALGGVGDCAPVVAAVRRATAAGGLPLNGSTGLLLALAAVRDRGVSLASVARPAADAARLLRLVARAGSSGDRVLAAVTSGRWTELVGVLGATDAFLPLVRWSAPDRHALVAAVTATPGAAASDRRHTRFGGALLLLPLLDDLWSWQAVTAGWHPAGQVPAERLARLVTLGAALGRARFSAALDDPVLRTALAVPGDVDVVAWLDGVDPKPFLDGTELATGPVDPWLPEGVFPAVAAAALLRDLGRRLPGMAQASPAYLWHNVLDVEAWVRLEEDTALVELGHAPLGVLLGITGLARTTFTVPGAGERRWTLTSRS